MAAHALEKSQLETKDREQLLAIADALGVSSVSRATKSVLIDKILDKTGANAPAPKPAVAPEAKPVVQAAPAREPRPAATAPKMGADGRHASGDPRGAPLRPAGPGRATVSGRRG